MKNRARLSKYEYTEYQPPTPPKARVTLPRVIIVSTLLLAALVVGISFFSQKSQPAVASNPPSPVEKDVFTAQGTPISQQPLQVAGVEVPSPAVNLGTQPLNTAVTHQFTLRNTSSTGVTLGKAAIEVLQGCCPSDPVLNATRIEPGTEVPLWFSLPMGMHAGMDGAHLFRVTVPVQNDDGEQGTIQVYVKADFRPGASGGADHSHS